MQTGSWHSWLVSESRIMVYVLLHLQVSAYQISREMRPIKCGGHTGSLANVPAPGRFCTTGGQQLDAKCPTQQRAASHSAPHAVQTPLAPHAPLGSPRSVYKPRPPLDTVAKPATCSSYPAAPMLLSPLHEDPPLVLRVEPYSSSGPEVTVFIFWLC